MAKKAAKKSSQKSDRKNVKKVSKKSSRRGGSRKNTGTIADVEQLVSLMVDNDLSELNIEEGSRKIHLRRGGAAVPAAPAVQHAAAPAPQPQATPVASVEAEAETSKAAPTEDLIEIKSPMVGTFYAASSPDSDDFVQVGDNVSSETVVCIVEAMKVMNEIKAECSGTITEVCVKNAQPVEFGQVMFKVKP